MLPVKCCCRAGSAKPSRVCRTTLVVVVLALGAGLSLHLYAHHASLWWLPIVLLVIAHGAILSGIAVMVAHLRSARQGDSAAPAECCRDHEHGEIGKVIRTPRAYDWLVRVLALGGERRFRRRILDLADVQPGDMVLDVGCGTGTLLIEAAKRIGVSGAAHGIEPSAEMVLHARRKAKGQGVAVNLQEGSADRLPFLDASFDVVFCTLVLHHLPKAMQTAAIGEMRRVLRPGGRMVIADLQRPKTISAALSLITLFHRSVGAHASAPDWRELEQLLNQLGLHRVDRHVILGGTVGVLVGHDACPGT